MTTGKGLLTILFGDRMEPWEHRTFMVLTLVTYDMW